jgi:hypothetical protein
MAVVPAWDSENFDASQEQPAIVRPQLFFHCKIRPFLADGTRNHSPEADILLRLMYYSLFEPCFLTPHHPLQKAEILMVYDPSPVPILYVDHIENALCRVPLIPCFIEGNATPTIPASFKKKRASLFPHGEADTASNPGSRLFEINEFMWNYGRLRPREVSVAESCRLRRERQEEAKKKRQETRTLNARTNEEYSLAFHMELDMVWG